MTAMHAVEITNSQHTPFLRGLAEIMYAAYQLHVWLKTVKIVRVYLSTAVKVNRRLSTEIRKKWLFIAMAQITGRK
ncbi:hypothetical protein OkiPb00155_05230 [Escherichia coli]